MRSLWKSRWLFLVVIFSCSNPRDACLDINATNYDVTAEVDCITCCNYPNLVLQFAARFEGEPLLLNQFVYTNASGETYGIVSGSFLLSNFVFTDNVGMNFRIRDSVLYPRIDSDSLFFKRDFVYFSDLSTRNYSLGLFQVQNNYVRMGLNLGLSGSACAIDPPAVPPNDNIGRAFRGLYDDKLKDYFAARFELIVDTIQSELITKVIYLPLCGNDLRHLIDIDVLGSPGFDLPIPLRLNLNVVLGNISLAELDSLHVLPQLRSDFLNGFYIE